MHQAVAFQGEQPAAEAHPIAAAAVLQHRLQSEDPVQVRAVRLRADKAPFTTHGVLSLGNKQLVMSFTNKPSVTLTLDQVVELVDQLSPADKLKVAKRSPMPAS